MSKVCPVYLYCKKHKSIIICTCDGLPEGRVLVDVVVGLGSPDPHLKLVVVGEGVAGRIEEVPVETKLYV